jgi:hypothetical protein
MSLCTYSYLPTAPRHLSQKHQRQLPCTQKNPQDSTSAPNPNPNPAHHHPRSRVIPRFESTPSSNPSRVRSQQIFLVSRQIPPLLFLKSRPKGESSMKRKKDKHVEPARWFFNMSSRDTSTAAAQTSSMSKSFFLARDSRHQVEISAFSSLQQDIASSLRMFLEDHDRPSRRFFSCL